MPGPLCTGTLFALSFFLVFTFCVCSLSQYFIFSSPCRLLSLTLSLFFYLLLFLVLYIFSFFLSLYLVLSLSLFFFLIFLFLSPVLSSFPPFLSLSLTLLSVCAPLALLVAMCSFCYTLLLYSFSSRSLYTRFSLIPLSSVTKIKDKGIEPLALLIEVLLAGFRDGV